ncbi:hypothetical protein STEG23_023942, partial [Scotinomys teguina]
FLLQCLEDLDSNLRKLNSRLFVIRGQPADVFPRLFKEWNITKLSIEYDSEPFGKERDAAIKKLAMEAGVEVIVRISHTLYDLDKIIELNGGQPPLTYKRFQTLVSKMEPLEMPAETITSDVIGKCMTPLCDDHDEKYGVPSLEELGFDTDGLSSAVWPGGETEALTRLERHLERKAWVANFERPRMNANSLLASPTGLSPYLRFGCLSCRLFYFKLTDLYKKVKKNSSPPLSLYGQLLWREFFYTAATNNPRFDKMEGNPICVQIPWDKNPEALAKWAEGRTGFPWIDAIMTQLRQEGWIHHLARHAVACFLTRGDLWISWEEGMKVFEELLLDADWSINAGSWMWLSCSSFFQQFFHCYCPVGFGRRTDPNGDYIRRYLPVLRGFPAKYIYDPWNAPEGIQKVAKCLIGVNYPKPMVNHAEASRLNIERMKQIYQQLSRYRGLGLLASVPSNPNGNGGLMGYAPGEQVPSCSSGGSCSQGSGILHYAHGDSQQTHLLKQGYEAAVSEVPKSKLSPQVLALSYWARPDNELLSSFSRLKMGHNVDILRLGCGISQGHSMSWRLLTGHQLCRLCLFRKSQPALKIKPSACVSDETDSQSNKENTRTVERLQACSVDVQKIRRLKAWVLLEGDTYVEEIANILKELGANQTVVASILERCPEAIVCRPAAVNAKRELWQTVCKSEAELIRLIEQFPEPFFTVEDQENQKLNVQFFQELGLKNVVISRFLTTASSIFHNPVENNKQMIGILQDTYLSLGGSQANAKVWLLKLLSQNPFVVLSSPTAVEQILKCLQGQGFTNSQVLQLLSKLKGFLFQLKPGSIQNSISFTQTTFECTDHDLRQLVVNCPALLYYPAPVLEERIQALLKEGISTAQIRESPMVLELTPQIVQHRIRKLNSLGYRIKDGHLASLNGTKREFEANLSKMQAKQGRPLFNPVASLSVEE